MPTKTFSFGAHQYEGPAVYGFGYQEHVRIDVLRVFREDLKTDPTLALYLKEYAEVLQAIQRGAEARALRKDGNLIGANALENARAVSETQLFFIWEQEHRSDIRVVEATLRRCLTPVGDAPDIGVALMDASPVEVDDAINFIEENKLRRPPPPTVSAKGSKTGAPGAKAKPRTGGRSSRRSGTNSTDSGSSATETKIAT